MISTPEEQYARLVEEILSTSEAQSGAGVDSTQKGFGSSGQLRIRGKIFAMLVRGRLVVKLPRNRVEQLIVDGHGERFDPGRGRLMKEWLSLNAASDVEWLPLANEALRFVASK